jgi:hypothetical protein
MIKNAKGQEGRISRPISKAINCDQSQPTTANRIPPKEKSQSFVVCFQSHANGDWVFAVADDNTTVQLCADCALALSIAAGRQVAPAPTSEGKGRKTL